jgi:hypothetical protein
MTDQENKERMKAAIAWHLANNFIPPQPPELVDYCMEAIEACNDGDDDRVITFPNGETVTAGQLVSDVKAIDIVEEQTIGPVVMKAGIENALALLANADEIATELSGRGLLDYKKSSALSTYFLRVLMPLRELIEYVEKELT